MGGILGDEGPAIGVDPGVHEEIERVVHVVRGEPELALRLRLDVVAVGVNGQAVLVLEQEAAASRIEHVVRADRIGDDRHHRPLARGRRPQEIAYGRVEAVQVTRTAGVEELLVVMEIEAVEVGALPADNLLDA